MRLKKLVDIGSAAVLSLSSMLIINLPTVHAAGTVTWTGTDCTAGSPDCTWSDTNNWSGGVVPGNGDDVVIDTSVNQGSAINTNTISSLAINSLTFINNTPSNPNYTLDLGSGLTINSAITQASSSTTTIPVIEGNIALGGDVLVTGNYIMDFTDTSPSTSAAINLNGFMLTFSDTGNTTGAPIVSISIPITGSGGVVYNAPQTDFQMSGASNYNGTTDVIATALPVRLGASQTGVGIFGNSTVTIESGGSASFNSDSSATVNNAITVAGTTSGSPITSLTFGCNLSCTGVTISAPNITLNGDTRFSNTDAGVAVNLAGITANGHCVEYLEAAGASGTFQNGPTACQVNTTGGGSSSDGGSAPGTPDTGLAAIIAHPVQTLLITSVMAIALLAIALRLKPIKHTK